MKYLKVFENQAEESAWKESEEYIKTSLSMVTQFSFPLLVLATKVLMRQLVK